VSNHRALRGMEQYTDFRALSNENVVFNVKKLSNDGMAPDSMAGVKRSDAGRMSSSSHGFRRPKVGFCKRTCQAVVYQELLRQHVFSWAKRMYPNVK
jgi:hypothetical protein